jgi:hypothetical protein
MSSGDSAGVRPDPGFARLEDDAELECEVAGVGAGGLALLEAAPVAGDDRPAVAGPVAGGFKVRWPLAFPGGPRLLTTAVDGGGRARPRSCRLVMPAAPERLRVPSPLAARRSPLAARRRRYAARSGRRDASSWARDGRHGGFVWRVKDARAARPRLHRLRRDDLGVSAVRARVLGPRPVRLP